MEWGRGHESGAGGTAAEGQNCEPDRACEVVWQNPIAVTFGFSIIVGPARGKLEIASRNNEAITNFITRI